MESVPNVLADRYASESLRRIWSPEGKVRLEREFWIAVLKAQKELGLNVPDEAIAAYEACIDQVDLEDIRRRETVTRHDVKARLETFCDLAGHQHLHKGLTSRDLTESVEQLQLYRALEAIHLKAVAALAGFRERALEFQDLLITARTHNIAAQPTTLGKRLSMYGEELLLATADLREILSTYPARGVKGAVGTRLDLMTLYGGDSDQARLLEKKVLAFLGLPRLLEAPGQVYPRSLDQRVVDCLSRLATGPGNFARALRLMAGHDAASEGFAKGQTGSSAMPHKINSRSCERINGFQNILRGHLTMAAAIGGDQWLEGDVSCSVVRRVVLPDACFAIDGLLETLLHVLRQMTVHPSVIAAENARFLPFLCTTTMMMKAVEAGLGREEAHSLIKEHAVAAINAMRSADSGGGNDLVQRLGEDSRFPLGTAELQSILDGADALAGDAVRQVRHFADQVESLLNDFPAAASLEPSPLL